MLLVALAMWRVLVAFEHYRLSVQTLGDPSIQELEWVSALVEGGIATLLLAHAAAVAFVARRSIVFRWPFAVSTTLLCTVIVSGALLDAPILRVSWVYALLIVVGMATLSRLLTFSWISLYVGAAAGGSLGFILTTPILDPLAGFFVAAPCVLFALIGAVLGRMVPLWLVLRAPNV